MNFWLIIEIWERLTVDWFYFMFGTAL